MQIIIIIITIIINDARSLVTSEISGNQVKHTAFTAMLDHTQIILHYSSELNTAWRSDRKLVGT